MIGKNAKDMNVPCTDLISRQAAIDALDNRFKQHLLKNRFESFEEADGETKWFCDGIMESIGAVMDLPAAQSERKLYANMSDTEFEEWLHAHGICNPNIHESIPCDAVPLLIDNAINELPSAQPTQTNAESTQDFGRDTNVPSTDFISRQAVIDLLKQMRKDGEMVPWEGKDVFARIRKLPAAQPERWDSCFSCPLSQGCPVIKGCTNDQAEQYAGEIPTDCPLEKYFLQLRRAERSK